MSMIDTAAAERRIAERVDPTIANAIAVSESVGGIAFRDAGEMMEFAKMMAVANSGVRKHLRGNPGACLAVLTQALEWGMSPFAVANKSYFVNDQIAFESQLVQAVILRRAPIRGRIHFDYTGHGTDRVCRAWARLREDGEVVEYTSPAIKDIKTKNSPLWTGDPDQQLSYFAGRSLCRRHFPDVLLGIYDQDELDGAPAIGPDRAREVNPRGRHVVADPLADEAPPRSVKADPVTVEHEQSQPDVDPTDETPADPREDLLAEIRAEMTGGRKVLEILNDLGDRRPLLTDEDVAGLKRAEKGFAKGGAS